MRALLRAELMRVRSRSAVWGTAVVLVIAALGFVVAAWDDTRPPSAAAVAEAHERLDEAIASWEEGHDDWVARCEEQAAAVPDWDDTYTCEELNPEPVLEVFLPYRPGLVETLHTRFAPMTFVVLVGLLVMGTVLVSGDFTSGAMGTWLTFAPRRGRVVASRLLASWAAAVPVVLVALACAGLGIATVVALHDAVGDTTGALGEVAATTGRALSAGLWATALGVGLAFGLRHGGLVAGVVVWWVAAVESALPLVVPPARGATLATNLAAWTDGGTTYTLEECVPDATLGEVCGDVVHSVSQARGGLVLLVVAVVVVGLGALSFRVRDVP